MIVFAVLDLVAGVGLWLTSTWGGVMWLLAIMSHILMGSFAPAGPGWRHRRLGRLRGRRS